MADSIEFIDKGIINNDLYDILVKNHIFHDFYIEKIKFSILKNKFVLILSAGIEELFQMTIKDIFSFKWYKDFLVDEDDYDSISWENIFKPLRYRHLLTIKISNSKYEEISKRYLRDTAIKVGFEFDFGYNVTVECLDFGIKKLHNYNIFNWFGIMWRMLSRGMQRR